MKKIFAFILASLMVLSLVPASAFAAITKEEECQKPHTVSNCEAVIVKTVEATCESAGYTIFKCTKCNEQFVGNVVEAGEHIWVLDTDHDDTKLPSCTENKLGYGVYECSVCGDTMERDIPVAELHKLTFVAGEGEGCEASYACSVCNGIFNANGGEVGVHSKWTFKEIITRPTAKTEGKALFVCEAKNCGVTKEVTIKPQCECREHLGSNQAKFYNWYAAGKLVLVTKPKNASCTSDGKWAIYKCVDCGTFYRWKPTAPSGKKAGSNATDLPVAKTNDDGQVTGIKNGSFGYVAKNENKTSSYKINKFGHDIVADNDKDHPIKVTGTCTYEQYCKRCKKYVAGEKHDWLINDKVEATCESFGYEFKICPTCGEKANSVVEPLGHDPATETYPSTCGNYGYIITYCKNDTKCSLSLPTLTVDGRYYNPANGKFYADVTVDHDGNGKDKVLRPIISIQDLTVLDGEHTLVSTPLIGGSSTGSCVGGGIVMQQCTKCNYYTYTNVAGTAHKYGETITVEATCTTPGSINKICTVCGYNDVVILPVLTAHKYVDVTINYTCFDAAGNYVIGYDGRPYHGVKIMACKYGCTGTDVTYYIDPVGSSTPKAWFESFEEAVLYHGASLTRTSYRAPTCTSAGYGIYSCDKCKKNVYITEPATAHVPTIDQTGAPIVIPAKNATCVTTGTKAYSVCSFCQSYITLNDKNEYVAITPAQLVTNPHTATVLPVVISSCDGISSVTYYVCSVQGCGKVFADAACTTPVAKLPADKAHGWKILEAGVVLNCNTDGYPQIRYCATCKTLELTQYAEFLKDGKVVVDVYGTPEVYNCEEYEISYKLQYVNGVYQKENYKTPKISHGLADNCPAEWAGLLMDDNAYSSTANCGDSYGYLGHVCLLCGYEYIDNFVPADGGHYNVYGELLEETCANYIAYPDRRCVTCNKMIGTSAALHDKSELKHVDATCISEGYDFYYCQNEGCTWYYIDPDTLTPAIKASDYHKVAANLDSTKVWDYANNGDEILTCKACKTVVKTNPSKNYNLSAGVEINMSTEFDAYMPNSYIELVISLDSLKGVEAWGLSFSIQYNPEVVSFVGAEFGTLFTTNNANALSGVQYVINPKWLTGESMDRYIASTEIGEYGLVTVASNSVSGVEIKGDNEYAVLTFKVIDSKSSAYFELGEVAPFAYTGSYQYYTAKVAGVNGKEVPSNYNGNKTLFVDVATYLDFDADGELTIMDAFELYYLIINDEYSVLADADHDKDVDTDDLDLLYKVLVGELSISEVVNPVVETEAETGLENDLNGDGILSPGADNGKAHPSLLGN